MDTNFPSTVRLCCCCCCCSYVGYVCALCLCITSVHDRCARLISLKVNCVCRTKRSFNASNSSTTVTEYGSNQSAAICAAVYRFVDVSCYLGTRLHARRITWNVLVRFPTREGVHFTGTFRSHSRRFNVLSPALR